MFCMNCGKPLPDGSKFCPHCGTPVISSEGRGSSEEGPSLDDLLKKVDKKEEKIYPIFCSPHDDSESLRPFHDGERGVYAFDMDGCHFEYDERQVGFFRLFKVMMAEAKTPAELKRIYLGEGDVKGLLQFVSDEKAVKKLFGSLLKKESSLLMGRGIYGLEFQNFMTRDTKEGAPSALDAWQDFIEFLLEKVGRITGSAEAARKSGHWRRTQSLQCHRQCLYKQSGKAGAGETFLIRGPHEVLYECLSKGSGMPGDGCSGPAEPAAAGQKGRESAGEDSFCHPKRRAGEGPPKGWGGLCPGP